MIRISRLLGLSAILTVLAMGASAKSYRCELYSTRIEVIADGSMDVTEEFVFRFQGGPFTRAHRELWHRKSEGIENIQSPDPIRISPGRSETRIRWTYPELRDTSRAFTLTYRIRGALRVEDGRRVLHWHLFPTEREYAIDRAQATLVLPRAWSPPEAATTAPSAAASIDSDTIYSYSFGSLKRGRSVVLNVVLPGEATVADMPLWQRTESLHRDRAPVSIALAGLLLLISLVVLVQVRRGAIADLGPLGVMPVVSSPPADLAPAIAGGIRDGSVTANHALATLLDLARRGIVRIESEGRRTLLGRHDARLSIPNRPAALARWETVVLDTAFRKLDSQGQVPLRKAWERIARNLSAFSRSLEADLESRGDFDPRMRGVRSRFYRLAVLFGALAVGSVLWILIDGFGALGPSSIAFTIALGLAALGAVLFGTTYPLHSAQGKERSLSWKAFAIYIKESARGASPVDPTRFDGWLPFAAAFGLLAAWFKAGKKWGVTPPAYLHAVGDGGADLAAWAAIFASMTTSGGGRSGPAGGGGGSGAS